MIVTFTYATSPVNATKTVSITVSLLNDHKDDIQSAYYIWDFFINCRFPICNLKGNGNAATET